MQNAVKYLTVQPAAPSESPVVVEKAQSGPLLSRKVFIVLGVFCVSVFTQVATNYGQELHNWNVASLTRNNFSLFH